MARRPNQRSTSSGGSFSAAEAAPTKDIISSSG